MSDRIEIQDKWQKVAKQYAQLVYGDERFAQAVQLGMALSTLNEEQLLKLLERTEKWVQEEKEKNNGK